MFHVTQIPIKWFKDSFSKTYSRDTVSPYPQLAFIMANIYKIIKLTYFTSEARLQDIQTIMKGRLSYNTEEISGMGEVDHFFEGADI